MGELVDDTPTNRELAQFAQCVGNMLIGIVGGLDANGNVPPADWNNARSWGVAATHAWNQAFATYIGVYQPTYNRPRGGP